MRPVSVITALASGRDCDRSAQATLRRPFSRDGLELTLRPELTGRVVELHEHLVGAAPSVVEVVALGLEVFAGTTVALAHPALGGQGFEADHGSSTSTGMRPTGSA